MKRLFLLFLLAIDAIFFTSCSNQEKRINKLWEIEKTINYQHFTISEQEKINELLKSFSQEEKYNKDSWNSGYSQQCSVLRRLYFEELISKEEFLTRCVNVYERYEKNQTNISFHTAGFAVCLYYLGQTERARAIFIEILKNGSEKNFGSEGNYELSVYICRKFLDEKNELYSAGIYSNMNEEDIINVFCGN